MKSKFLLLITALMMATASLYADCHDVPAVFTVSQDSTMINNQRTDLITFMWDPVVGATLYQVVYWQRDLEDEADTITTSRSSTYEFCRKLYNGVYCAKVRSICPDGTVSDWSEIACFIMESTQSKYVNPICAGVVLPGEDNVIVGGYKLLNVSCSQGKDTLLKPQMTITGGAVTGYTVEAIPFKPPYPFYEGEDVVMPNGDDNFGNSPILLPFRFCFFENTYEQVWLAPNGYLTFQDIRPGQYSSYQLGNRTNFPDPTVPGEWKNSIFGVMEDIDPRVGLSGRPAGYSLYRAGIRGDTGCRVFLVNYYRIPLFQCGNHNRAHTESAHPYDFDPEYDNTYQMVLYEKSNIIDVYIYRRSTCPTWEKGRGVVGVMNASGTRVTMAPGRNVQDNWTTITENVPQYTYRYAEDENGHPILDEQGNKIKVDSIFIGLFSVNSPEAWRFTPISTPTYTSHWYNNGGEIATGDSLWVSGDTALRDTLTFRVYANSCEGTSDMYEDKVIINFNLPRFKYNATVCAGKDFNEYGFHIKGEKIKNPGTYEFIDTIENTTSRNCDTIKTLILNVPQREIGNLTKEVCFSDSNLVWGRQRTQIITQAGYYTDTIFGATPNGCDSMYILYVYNVKGAESDITPPPVICANDASFKATFPPVVNEYKVPPTNYEVKFDTYSKNVGGFVDFSGIFTTSNCEIDVPLPEKVYPDRYGFTISLRDSISNCGTTDLEYVFDVYYPDTIFQQKWDDVIAIKNKYYNGGFEFLRYQWYRNGVEMPGETGSYINTPLTPGDKYSALLTRLDGTQMMSCDIVAKVANPDITINPTITTANNFIKIYVERGGALVNIWNITGVLVMQTRINAPQQDINAPSAEGTYIIEVLTDNGQRKVQPLIVTQ